jgi:tRNA(Ile)-lysidine synthase TilS/MesJ
MALAFLINRLRAREPLFRIADNTMGAKPIAVVVDHKLRPESTEEAVAVMKQLSRFPQLTPELVTINWRDELQIDRDFDVSSIPNIESLARRYRYRRLAKQFGHANIASMFTAHHQDDQYETILMRLLSGHGVRGLRGMSQGGNIPECYDMHNIYESGFIDDQLRAQPFINFRPRRRDWRFTRRDLREEINLPRHMAELRAGLQTDLDIAYIDREYGDDPASRYQRRKVPAVPAIPTEDMGMVIYRPLLDFSKDRLIATCEANNIKWFEDPTNQDETMTLRNAVRHMWKNHDLPVALQKESVLQLSRWCVDKTRAQEQEAGRWLSKKAIIHNFDPNTGTLVVKVPDMTLHPPRRRSIYNRRRRELRLSHRRTIAALIIRKLVAFVTPDRMLPVVHTLQSPVARLFPSIAPAGDAAKVEIPKSFSQASVLFIPLQRTTEKGLAGANPLRAASPQKWFLTRQPYTSSQPLPNKTWVTKAAPKALFHFLDHPESPPWAGLPPEQLEANEFSDVPMASKDWHPWRQWAPYDGRYWVRLRARFKGAVRVAPYNEAYAKEFREGLDDKGRAALADLLRRYAPGKVRYTLPALYTVDAPPPDSDETAESDAAMEVEDLSSPGEDDGGDAVTTAPSPQPVKPAFKSDTWVSDIDSWRGKKTRIKLLALLTLPVHLPGVEEWLQWEARYKKVDTALLDDAMLLPHPHRQRRQPTTGLRWRVRRRCQMKLYQHDKTEEEGYGRLEIPALHSM